MEGSAKLIIHKTKVDNTIPNILLVNIPIKKIANDPLMPSSTNVVVGIKVATRYIKPIEM